MKGRCESQGRHGLVVVASLALLVAFSPFDTARGVNIVLNFDASQSETPSFDPTAAGLISIFEFAENLWQDIFEDSHTLTINFWYEDLPSGQAALHTFIADDGVRETEADIRVDTMLNGTERAWFIDPTPENDSEFNMSQTLWRDLTPNQQTNFFNVGAGSTVPDTFEIGYTGAPVVGGAADNLWDMVTSVTHEVGHALGLNSFNAAEVADNDLDFDTDFVFGNSIAAQGDTLNGSPDNSHLAATNIALLCGGCAQADLRRLPSHTDIFAIASSGLWSDIDAPRREFYGNTNWNNSGNWSGDTIPGAADDVFVRDAQGAGVTLAARLTADGVAGSLTVSEGANVDTDGFKLDVTGDVTVSNIDSDIFIDPGGELEADEVFVEDEAEIEMSGGLLDARIVKTKPAGQLQSVTGGLAQVIVSQLFINNGQIEADGDSVIVLNSLADFPWDLDGDTEQQDGIVDASDGNITVLGGGLADPFDGTMLVGAGHMLSIFAPWTNSSGTIDLNGGANFDTRARISGLAGDTVHMTGGTIEVSGVAHIDAPVFIYGGIFNPAITLGADDTLEFNGDATVAGGTWTLGQGSNVLFNGATTVSGGTFTTFSELPADGLITFHGSTTYSGHLTINGIGRQEGNATVENATTIDASVFDLDGTGAVAGHTWTLNDALIVNADAIDVSGNVFASQFIINSTTALVTGKLTINLPGEDEWTAGPNSTLVMNGQTNVFSSTVAGSDFNLDGTATITDNVAWDARANIAGAITINADSNLRLLGGAIADPYVLEGGSISGLGTLSTIGDRALVGHGTIATELDFFNEAELRADDGTLVVSGTMNDVGVLGTADADGTLEITNPWNTSVTDLVELRGGSIIGAAITNASTNSIEGFGTLAPNNLSNDGTIAARDGALAVDVGTNIDLDGATENGEIAAVDGNLTVVDALGEHFDGVATAGPNRSLTFQNGWILGSAGQLDLDGGSAPGSFTTVAGSQQNLRGAVNGNRAARFDIQTRFKFDVAVSLPDANDSISLLQPSVVEAGATFSGLGVLANSPGNTLTLENGASIGVNLFNAGTLEIGSSPGTATALAFAQNALGTLHLEVGGTNPADYDQLLVSNHLNFGGKLQIDAVNSFLPTLGDSFDLFDFNSASGTFSTLTLPTLAAELMWNTSRLYVDGVLSVTPAGDFNVDGTVDAADYVAWRKGLSPFPNAAGDYNLWRSQFGQSIGPGASPESQAASSNVPEPTTLATFVACGIILFACRRRR